MMWIGRIAKTVLRNTPPRREPNQGWAAEAEALA